MQDIIDWFVEVSETITDLIDYVVGVIEDIVEMVEMLGTAASDLPEILCFLPPPVTVLLGSFLTAAILYKVLGREG